ncbi:hypothetical protein M0812_03808 [Anaeramoeba flamelloides]|uniref:Uncharacterized protein n=1 Tax=Anaeramoeba flamelloides TaxID=1746091 RepID=A0AAV8AGT5_9EUKA|nr:hypothetical protein M0812_03808 [Anaeramoeba flamelloides]
MNKSEKHSLFKLIKLVERSVTNSQISSNKKSIQYAPKKQYQFTCCATGIYASQYTILAFGSDDNTITFLISERSSTTPLIRYLKLPTKHTVSCLCFSPKTDTLLVVTNNFTILLIALTRTFNVMLSTDLQKRIQIEEKRQQKQNLNNQGNSNYSKGRNKNNVFSQSGSLQVKNKIITYKKATKSLSSGEEITCCKWWKSVSKKNYSIVGSLNGNIFIVDLKNGNVARKVTGLGGPISRLALYGTSLENSFPFQANDKQFAKSKNQKPNSDNENLKPRYVVVTTSKNTSKMILLEAILDLQTRVWKTIVEIGPKKEFKPRNLIQRLRKGFQFDHEVRKSNSYSNSTLVRAYSPLNKTIEIFETVTSNFPLFIYKLRGSQSNTTQQKETKFKTNQKTKQSAPSVTSSLLASTRNLLYTCTRKGTRKEGRTEIDIISKFYASDTQSISWELKETKDIALLQRFLLPPNETVRGIFRKPCPKRSNLTFNNLHKAKPLFKKEKLYNSNKKKTKNTSVNNHDDIKKNNDYNNNNNDYQKIENNDSNDKTEDKKDKTENKKDIKDNKMIDDFEIVEESNKKEDNNGNEGDDDENEYNIEHDICILWTQNMVYELKLRSRPETICKELNKIPKFDLTEKLGKTFGLNLFELYEQEADELISRLMLKKPNLKTLIDLNAKKTQEIQLITKLYELSNAKPEKVVSLLIKYGYISYAIKFLKKRLKQLSSKPSMKMKTQNINQKNNNQTKKNKTQYNYNYNYNYNHSHDQKGKPPQLIHPLDLISTLLLRCYVQQLLSVNIPMEQYASLLDKVDKFVYNNLYYDPVDAMKLFLKTGLRKYFFDVAKSKNIFPFALSMLYNSKKYHLAKYEVEMIINSGYSKLLIEFQNGIFFSSLDQNQILKLIKKDPNLITMINNSILSILPSLGEQNLLNLESIIKKLVNDIFAFVKSKKKTIPKVIFTKMVELLLICKCFLLYNEYRNSKCQLSTNGIKIIKSLKADLKKFQSYYRPSIIITRCIDLQLFGIISIIHILDNNFYYSIKFFFLDLQNQLNKLNNKINNVDKNNEGNVYDDNNNKKKDKVDEGGLVKNNQDSEGKLGKKNKDDDNLKEKITNIFLIQSSEMFNLLHNQNQSGTPKTTNILTKFIKSLLLFWKNNDLKIVMIEKFFEKKLPLFGYYLAQLFGKNLDQNEDKYPLLLPFNPNFHLTIVKIRMNDSIKILKKRQKNQNQINQLLVGIKENLERNLKKNQSLIITNQFLKNENIYLNDACTNILLNNNNQKLKHNSSSSSSSAQSPSSSSPSSSINHNHDNNNRGNDNTNIHHKNKIKLENQVLNQNELVIFTCGHHFPIPQFSQILLPEFKKRMEKNLPDLSQTTKLILQNFKSKSITSGCPVCVFNSLITEFNENFQLNKKTWKIQL